MSTPVAYVSLWRVSETIHRGFISKLYGLYENGSSLFYSIAAFCCVMWPYVLPPLLSILLEAPLSLRTWIAVQKTPAPIPTYHAPRLLRLRRFRKHIFTHIAPVYFLFSTLLVSYLHCVVRVDAQSMCIFEAVVFGPLFWFASSRLFGILSRIYKLSVRRDADGDSYLVRSLRPSIPRVFQILPVSLGLLVTYGAIHLDDAMCKAAVHVALLHVFISSDSRTRESMRAAGVYALTNIATLLALTIFLAIQSRNVKLLFNTPSPQSTYPAWEEFSASRLSSSDIIDIINNNSSTITSVSLNPGPTTAFEHDGDVTDEIRGYRWPLFALAVLWNIFPVELATLCYRFDYTRFVKRRGITFTPDPSSLNGGRGESSLTHDMLPNSTSRKEKGVSEFGPIYLPPDAPDAFYNRLATSPPPYSDGDVTSRASLHTSTRIIPHPTSPQQTSTPLPSSLSIPTRIPFPAFLTSLTVYLLSTLSLSLLFYIAFSYQPSSSTITLAPAGSEVSECWNRRDEALRYLVPLLPLVTLPLTTFAVPLGLVFSNIHSDDEDEEAVKELWRYEETWTAPVSKQEAREVSNGANE